MSFEDMTEYSGISKMPTVPEAFASFVGEQITSENTLLDSYEGYEVWTVDNDDPVLVKIKTLAEEKGLTMRVIPPNTAVTLDYCTNRLNVNLASSKTPGVLEVVNFYLG